MRRQGPTANADRLLSVCAFACLALCRAECDIGVQLRTGAADGNTFGLGYLASYDDVLTLIDFIWAKTHARPLSTLNLFLTTDARDLRSSFVDDITRKFQGTATVEARYLSKPASPHSFKHDYGRDSASATTFIEFFQLSQCHTVVYTGGSNFGRMAAVYGDVRHEKRSSAWEFLFDADNGDQQSPKIPKGQAPRPRRRRPYASANSINTIAPDDSGAKQMYVLEARYACGQVSVTNRPVSEMMTGKSMSAMNKDPYLDC